MSICEKCGRDLYRALMERYPTRGPSPFLERKLPDPNDGPGHVTIRLERVKEFNSDYSELAEFAAWACGVDPKKFCRSDMMRATGAWKEIQRRIAMANGEDDE